MSAATLDHVNIHTRDPAGTARFFADLLGLTITPGPAGLERNPWLRDGAGHPAVHIQLSERGDGAAGTGPLDHVAFRCAGYPEMLERVRAAGLPHRLNHIPDLAIRQIFVAEPNGVQIELNFYDS